MYHSILRYALLLYLLMCDSQYRRLWHRLMPNANHRLFRTFLFGVNAWLDTTLFCFLANFLPTFSASCSISVRGSVFPRRGAFMKPPFIGSTPLLCFFRFLVERTPPALPLVNRIAKAHGGMLLNPAACNASSPDTAICGYEETCTAVCCTSGCEKCMQTQGEHK